MRRNQTASPQSKGLKQKVIGIVQGIVRSVRIRQRRHPERDSLRGVPEDERPGAENRPSYKYQCRRNLGVSSLLKKIETSTHIAVPNGLAGTTTQVLWHENK